LVDEEQEGFAGVLQSVLVEHSTQLFERQIGEFEGQSEAVPHSTQVPPEQTGCPENFERQIEGFEVQD